MKKAINFEPITGEKVFKTVGRFVTAKPGDLGSMLFVGILAGVIDPPVGGEFEIWDCEITIKPRKKAKLKSKYATYRYDQIVSGGLLNPSADVTDKPYYEG